MNLKDFKEFIVFVVPSRILTVEGRRQPALRLFKIPLPPPKGGKRQRTILRYI